MKNELALLLEKILKRMQFRPKYFFEAGEMTPCMTVRNMDNDQIVSSIKKAFETLQNEWKLIEIDVDTVNDICERMNALNRNELIQFQGNKLKTFLDLPFYNSSPCIDIEKRKQIVADEGFGVLLLTNFNENNYNILPRNFIYNLTKNHSFNHVGLNPNWLIMIEMKKNTRLDNPGGVMFSYSQTH